MNRNIPIGNKICATKEIFQNQVILNTHLLTMRPQINTSAPKQYDFLKNKKIKDAIKSQKQQEIDRENQNLISKLTTIMQQQTNNSISTLAIKKSATMSIAQKKSLNKDYRKKELIKIVMENQQLLKRIQDQKSQYNVKDWNQERKWVEKYISNISEYPYKDFKPTKTLVQYWTNSRISESQLQKRDNLNNKKLDPLEIKSQQNKQRARQDNNNTDSRQLLTNQENQQRSLFESDFQPYEPYQDKVSKIVNEIIEKPQLQEQEVKKEQIQVADDQNHQDQPIPQENPEIVATDNLQSKDQDENQNNEQEQDLQQQNEANNLMANAEENQEQLNQESNSPQQNHQNIQTIDFEQQNEEPLDQQSSEKLQD
ncbi:unnamed protein product (macronuclear) [Paramecium tetraurelia]|uniref:IQ calmodulin-binding motif protein n=1 Tax=Paramecium tetraurelia TaxID=5888 RepID=A0E9G5_PARTE|nr:uncharacterized protein GSPATT00024663001 [Paramecium tetraurelia]CAK91932.1 unnamed protein product [Paramecium tetraurelia]|eukprot:XP_001459329.1 hypothetical protein (macronuclear) [Paramecium tetraurelia strain d4-2]